MPDVTELRDGLKKAYAWYENNQDKVNKKPYFEYIDSNLVKYEE